MANRYWVGGTATWDATAGSKWSLTSGGAGGEAVPTSSDDVFFDANSGAVTVTLSGSRTCASINFTGFTGTFAGGSSNTLTVSGSATFVAGMTVTGSSWTLTFDAAGNLTSGGKTLAIVSFQSTSTNYTVLQDSLTVSNQVTLVGALDTNNQTVSTPRIYGNSTNTFTVNLGSSSITVSGNIGLDISSLSNLTLNAGTSTITMTGSSAPFNGNGKTFYNVTYTGAGVPVFTGDNTYNNLTRTGTAVKTDGISFAGNPTINGTLALNGNSVINRLIVKSDTVGTARTITSATNSITNADFRDITGAGAASWNLSAITGNSGDCGGNSGITFTTPATSYWVPSAGTSTGSMSASTRWASSSGGTAGTGRAPLPQDTSVFDANSIDAGSRVITQDMVRIGAVNWTGATNTPTWTKSTVAEVYGSITTIAAMTLNSGSSAYTFAGRSLMTFTTAGNSWPHPTTIATTGSNGVQLSGNSVILAALTLTSGTLDLNDLNLTANSFTNTGSATRTLDLGTGTFEVSATGTVWNSASTGLTVTANTGKILISNTSASTKTFTGGGINYNGADLEISGAASNGAVTVSGSNTFDVFILNPYAYVKLTSGTTTTVNSLNWSGVSGQTITIESTSAGSAATISDASGSNVVTYCSIKDSTASGGATFDATNSTNVSGNTGWVFAATGSGTLFMLESSL